MSLHYAELQRFLKLLCEANGVTLIYDKRVKAGMYYMTEATMRINPDMTNRVLPFVICHELGHHYCCKNKIWKHYHQLPSKIKKKKFIATALKAERWCDRYGKYQAELIFENIDCYMGYSKARSYKEISGVLSLIN